MLDHWNSPGSLPSSFCIFVFLSDPSPIHCLSVLLSICISSSYFILVHLRLLELAWKPSEPSIRNAKERQTKYAQKLYFPVNSWDRESWPISASSISPVEEETQA